MILSALRNLIARFRADDIDDELVSIARREFLKRTGAVLALPIVAPIVADQLLELLPSPRILVVRDLSALPWRVNTLGGYFYSRQLSKVLRANIQPLVRFRQFADNRGLCRPGKLTWDVYGGVRA